MLLGYSFGAHVAVEMARLLHEHNHTVQLILIDSSVEHDALVRFGDTGMVDAVFNSFKPELERSVRNEDMDEFLSGLQQEVARNLRMMSRYRMRYFPWSATFLQAEHDGGTRVLQEKDISNGYRALVKELVVDHLIGDHYSVFSAENISFNSHVIRKALRLES